MSPFRPDLVDCWMFRVGRTARDIARPEILLIRRAPGRILPGLWQCVSGSLEPGERVALGALRELAEETGFGPADIEGFYDLDLVNQFHEPSVDGIVTAAVFAVRLHRTPSRASRTSTTARTGTLSRRRISRSSGPATGPRSNGSATTCPTRTEPSGSS